jgi:uncharacterized protein (DUF58 family)
VPTARSILILAGGLIAAGLGFDVPSLYVPGAGLALLVGGAWLWVGLAAGPVRASRVPPRPSVDEDEPLELLFAVTTGRVPPPVAEIRDPLLAEPVALGPALSSRTAFTASWRRRGRKRLGPTSVVIRDPFGIRARETPVDGEASVLVLPRLEPIRAAAEGSAAGALGLLTDGAAARRGAAAIEVEIDGLRPYRDGSPASRIHWPTVARTGEMVERRLDAGTGGRPLVVLDSSAPASEEALDRSVRAAASLVHRLALAGGCGLAISGAPRVLEVDSRLRGWQTAHARLALVESGGRPPALRGGRARGAAVFWVTPSRTGSSPAARLDFAEAFVVAPLDGGGEGTTFTVAGCGGRRLLRGAGRVGALARERAA